MTAGRCLRTSPPTAGSKLTHQTSPRFIGDVRYGAFGPFQRFGFANLFPGHLLVGCLQVFAKYMGTYERLDEPANATPTHDAVQTRVDAFVKRNGQLLLQDFLRAQHVLMYVL